MNRSNIYVDGKGYELEFYKSGAYGTVFKPKNKDFVYKVFKSRNTDLDNFLIENTFRSEVLAYKKLVQNENLKLHVPYYHGTVKIDNIEINSEIVTGEYRCDLAYQIQFIEGQFRKIGHNKEVKDIISKFKTIDIHYIVDADYCYYENTYKFIDFGILGVLEELENKFYSQRYSDLESTKKNSINYILT